jgi:hypothetical protein
MGHRHGATLRPTMDPTRVRIRCALVTLAVAAGLVGCTGPNDETPDRGVQTNSRGMASESHAESISSISGEQPIYWVDGARPDPGADSGTTKGVPAGCVPYSEARPDVHICGDVLEDYSPAPVPYRDPEICSAGLEWLRSTRASMRQGGATDSQVNSAWPLVRKGSCLIQGEGDVWLIRFQRIGGSHGYVSDPYDPSGEDSSMAHL